MFVGYYLIHALSNVISRLYKIFIRFKQKFQLLSVSLIFELQEYDQSIQIYLINKVQPLMRVSRSSQQSKKLYLKHFFSFYAPSLDTTQLQQSLLEGNQIKKSQYLSSLTEKHLDSINRCLSFPDIKRIINLEFKLIDKDLQNEKQRLFQGIKIQKDIEYLKLKILNGGYQQEVKQLKKILNKKNLELVTERITEIESKVNQRSNPLSKYMKNFEDMELDEIDDKQMVIAKLQQIIKSVFDQRIVSQLQYLLTADCFQMFQKCLTTLKQRRQQQIQQFTKQRYEQQMRRQSQISKSFILPPSSNSSSSNEVIRISSNISSISPSNRLLSVIQPQFQILNDEQLQLTNQIKSIINEIQIIFRLPVQNNYRSLLFPNFYNYEKQQQQKRKQQFALNNGAYNYQLDGEYFQRFAEHRMKRTNRSQALQLNHLARLFVGLFQASKLTASKLLFFVYQLSIHQQSKRQQITDQILILRRRNDKMEADNKYKVLQGLFNIKLQSFIYELIYYNWVKHSVYASQSSSKDINSFLQGSYQSLNQESKIIFRYYELVLNNQIPFNMLSENSLAFGNIYAKKAMDKMKVILKDKKLFVISIIGTQSSAKSSLLNKLFQLGFKVSGGRCTIGINIILLHRETSSILIIDSQGTSSRDREDANFDIRINTFIMLISDVLIINIKGELSRDQTQLINNCSFILNQLNKDSPKVEERQGTFFGKPKRVIFALRDINDLSETNLQKQKLSIIDYTEKSKNRLRQQLALAAAEKDIFIFPNSKQNSGNFDKTIIQMRNSIMQQLQYLKQGKYSTLLDFYTDSQKAWNILINLSADRLHQYKYEYMKKMREQIQKQAHNLQRQLGRKDCKQISAIYDRLKQYHDIQAIQQNERMLYQGLRLTIKEKGERKWIKIQRSSLQKVEGVDINEIGPILKLCFDNQMLNIQLKEEYRFKKQLQNYKKYKKRQIYVQRLKLQVKDKIKQGYDRDRITKYLDQKQKVQQSRKQQQIKKLQKISSDLSQQFNIKKIQYSDILHVKKKYYFLREQIKKAISILSSSESEMSVVQQIQSLQQIYNFLTKNVAEVYIKQHLLLSPNNRIYQMKSLDNKDVFYYVIDFLNTATQIMEKVIDEFVFVDQSRDLQEFLHVIQYKLDAHYNQLKVKLEYYYDLDIKLTQSAIMHVDAIKLAPKTKYFKILYSILPLKILLKTIKQQSQYIKLQIKSITNIHNTAKQQLSYLDKTQFRLCRYWFKHFIQMIIKQSFHKAKRQIDKVINKSFITPQKIIMDIFLSKVVKFNHRIAHEKQEYLQLYKLFINFERYMIEWYRRNIFEKEIIKNVYRIIERSKIKNMDDIENFQAKVINIEQSIKKHENQMEQRPIEYFYQLLFNNRTLFFPDFVKPTIKDIFIFFKLQITLKQSQLKQIYANQIIGYEISLQDYCEQQLKKKIYPIIIGCPQKCPKCGVKCKLRSLHAGPHEVIQGMHYLYCFNPENNRQKKQCDKSWCCDTSFSSVQRQYKFDNCHDSIMGWYKSFYHGGNFSEDNELKKNLKHIWAHIGPVALQIRKSKAFMDNESKNLAKKPLKMSDLEKNNLLDYHQDYFRK